MKGASMTLLEQAQKLLSEKKYDDALKLFDEVLKGDPGNTEALLGKIAVLRETQEFSQANRLLRDALTRHPNHAGILSEQAWLLLAEKKYDEAIKSFSKVLQIKPDLGIYMWKAALLRDRRRCEEAELTLDEANRIFKHVPQEARIRSERGWLHFYQKRYDEAHVIFRSVVRD